MKTCLNNNKQKTSVDVVKCNVSSTQPLCIDNLVVCTRVVSTLESGGVITLRIPRRKFSSINDKADPVLTRANVQTP